MSFWIAMNYVAWGLCVAVIGLILADFINVEKGFLKQKSKKQNQ